MKWIKNMIVAFSLYSKIPMPRVQWTKQNMRISLCFFPLVGAVIGILMWLWCLASEALDAGSILRAAGFVLIPVLVSGGIHLDGLLDTADALSSWQSREKRLEILKDPHTGAFAVIVCCAYFLASAGIWSEADMQSVRVLAPGFILSRALSGFGICTFPCAGDCGMAATFSAAADKMKCRVCLLAEAAACIFFMIFPDWKRGIPAAAAALIVCLICRGMAMRKFGGITGDIQGFFLQMCELAMAYAAILSSCLTGRFVS